MRWKQPLSREDGTACDFQDKTGLAGSVGPRRSWACAGHRGRAREARQLRGPRCEPLPAAVGVGSSVLPSARGVTATASWRGRGRTDATQHEGGSSRPPRDPPRSETRTCCRSRATRRLSRRVLSPSRLSASPTEAASGGAASPVGREARQARSPRRGGGGGGPVTPRAGACFSASACAKDAPAPLAPDVTPGWEGPRGPSVSSGAWPSRPGSGARCRKTPPPALLARAGVQKDSAQPRAPGSTGDVANCPRLRPEDTGDRAPETQPHPRNARSQRPVSQERGLGTPGADIHSEKERTSHQQSGRNGRIKLPGQARGQKKRVTERPADPRLVLRKVFHTTCGGGGGRRSPLGSQRNRSAEARQPPAPPRPHSQATRAQCSGAPDGRPTGGLCWGRGAGWGVPLGQGRLRRPRHISQLLFQRLKLALQISDFCFEGQDIICQTKRATQ